LLLMQVVHSVHGIMFKDLKQILRKEQCDASILLTANVPSAKKIIVHGPQGKKQFSAIYVYVSIYIFVCVCVCVCVYVHVRACVRVGGGGGGGLGWVGGLQIEVACTGP
jgi:hypothetical protein